MLLGTIAGKEIECQLQGLDCSELGWRKWQCIRAREKDMEGEKEYRIGNLGRWSFRRYGFWR
jgi:hypothetical protein